MVLQVKYYNVLYNYKQTSSSAQTELLHKFWCYFICLTIDYRFVAEFKNSKMNMFQCEVWMWQQWSFGQFI